MTFSPAPAFRLPDDLPDMTLCTLRPDEGSGRRNLQASLGGAVHACRGARHVESNRGGRVGVRARRADGLCAAGGGGPGAFVSGATDDAIARRGARLVSPPPSAWHACIVLRLSGFCGHCGLPGHGGAAVALVRDAPHVDCRIGLSHAGLDCFVQSGARIQHVPGHGAAHPASSTGHGPKDVRCRGARWKMPTAPNEFTAAFSGRQTSMQRRHCAEDAAWFTGTTQRRAALIHLSDRRSAAVSSRLLLRRAFRTARRGRRSFSSLWACPRPTRTLRGSQQASPPPPVFLTASFRVACMLQQIHSRLPAICLLLP